MMRGGAAIGIAELRLGRLQSPGEAGGLRRAAIDLHALGREFDHAGGMRDAEAGNPEQDNGG